MVLRLWRALGVPAQAVQAYLDLVSRAPSPSLVPHASLSGVADPFASLPAGTVLVPGLSTTRLFVTRFPCVKPADGRLLPVVNAKPPSMTQEQWEWLQQLPFGLIIFSVRGDRPLPEICGSGDLDGDLYFACWHEELVLSHVRPREPPPNPRPTLRASQAPAPAPRTSTPAPRLDLASAYNHMASRETLHGNRLVGRLFRAWEGLVAQRAAGMDDPDALLLADAYLQALTSAKHGGDIGLPPHLRAMVALPPLSAEDDLDWRHGLRAQR
mmetsp:Transcript_4241/g.12386  ORF Transcript_4241/g.12386 Transcript_4241/m.12386 type:complete len:269 (+) Transcript_4241:3-809(+)